MEHGFGQGTFVHVVRAPKQNLWVDLTNLGHLNHEEYNFDVSFHICICEKDIFKLVRILWFECTAFSLWEICFMFGGICHLFCWRVSHKRHLFFCGGRQLLSVELEEGFSSAWIRLMYQSLSSLGFLRNLPWLAEHEESPCDSSIKNERQ